MGLRLKFSLLLSLCALLPLLLSAIGQARFFAADQQAYLNDFQSTLALSAEKQLRAKSSLLFAHLSVVFEGGTNRFGASLQKIPDAIDGAVWVGDRLMASTYGAEAQPPPPEPGSDWSLSRAPGAQNAIRWIGRQKDRVILLDLKLGWLSEILEPTHGAILQLVFPDGWVALPSEGAGALIDGRPLFDDPAELERAFTDQNGFPRTRKFKLPNGIHLLGTSMAIATDPPFLVTVSAPLSVVEEVVSRTYRQSAWLAFVVLVSAIGVGVAFSSHLTSPIRALVDRSRQVAEGKFEAFATPLADRRDEVGLLARSLGRMGLELVKMQGELRKSERLAALGRFGSAIAHEIKNPLASILGNNQVARDIILDPGTFDRRALQEALNYVEEETHRANDIVTRLMKFAREERPPENVINLAERIQRSLSITAPLFAQANVLVHSEICAEAVFCVADGDQLHEVFLNLVQNALYALKGSSEKSFSLSLRKEGSWAVWRIGDTGSGMSEETLAHLFEPFFTTKPIGQGTGLGLAVCHGIIDNHRGTIAVESAESKGTVFTIRLPLAASLEQPIAA